MKKRSKVVKGARIAGVVLLVVVLSAFLFRSVIASRIAESRLQDHGVDCDSVDIHVSWDFSTMELGPTRCRLASDRVEGFSLRSATITRSGGDLAVDLPELTVELSSGSGVGGVPGLLLAANGDRATPRLIRAIEQIARLSQHDLPPTSLGEVHLRRGDDELLTLSDVTLRPNANALSFAIGAVHGSAQTAGFQGEIEGIEGEATASSVRIEGDVKVRIGAGPIAASREVAFRITGTELDGADPQVRVWTDIPAELQQRLRGLGGRLHDRVDALRDRLERRQQPPQ